MRLLIESIEQLRQYIRINKSADFSIYRTFILDAQNKYIMPFFGETLVESIDSSEELFMYICSALAPFSMAHATDEFSIAFGESGHTVLRSDSVAPASETKIEKAKASLFDRGWENLDKALKHVESHKDDYPDWKIEHSYNTLLFKNAKEFQDNGMVDIDYSFLTFYHLRLLISRIEKTETFMMLPDDLRLTYQTGEIPMQLKSAMQAYTGSRVASLHTSIATRSQRAHPGSSMTARVEYEPVIRPLYADTSDTGNYFESQVEFWKAQISDALIKMDAIEPDAYTLKWNSQERRIFVPGAKRKN